MKIDYTKLKGEVLFEYFTNDHPDKDYSSVVALLIYAIEDANDAYALLEKSVEENKVFVAVYPAIEKTDTSNMEYVGSIPDGMLYLK